MRSSVSCPILAATTRHDQPRVFRHEALHTAGGASQGAKLPASLRSTCTGGPVSRPASFPAQPALSDARYTHGWQSHMGQDFQQKHLYNESSKMSHYWTLGKSKNHIGYGVDGRVNPSEVQGTAVSGDSPTWFCGPRTFEGPYHCKAVPVRRCPVISRTRDGQLLYTQKTYRQGPCMDIQEEARTYTPSGTLLETEKIALAKETVPSMLTNFAHQATRDGSRTPGSIRSSVRSRASTRSQGVPEWLAKASINPAKGCHMKHGGCTMLRQ
eukprot:TRINITY_DN30266_c0_g2_i1.p1 TRINITY_DN30266_c0_g2~~TRINITY_DN30266_c0_g2_i1.p1  ORF type:complete len:269 (+),score=32.01 TRINITY_DN30266_c0_g2_i1:60-866(+)